MNRSRPLFAAAILGALLGATRAPSAQGLGAGSEPSPDLLVAEDGRSLPAMMLRLRSGDLLWGGIESHDPQVLVFRRLENGGRVTLPWGLLDPAQEQELRMLFGYVELAVEEVLVAAHRIPIVDGTELIGLIVNRTDDLLHVKTSTSLIPLEKSRVAGPAVLVQVPALDIYTREELYTQKMLEYALQLAPPAGEEFARGREAAEAHLEVARYCERILDFEHARDHYVLAVEADPSIQDAALEMVAQRAAAKAAVQEQVDLLAEIDTWRARKKFDRALAMIVEFRDTYPKSPLLEDLFKLEARVVKVQEKTVRSEVVKRWHYYTSRLIGKSVRHMSFGQAQGWADSELSEEIAEAVRADVSRLNQNLSVELVRKYFSERVSYKTYRASYGLASWMLGAEEARKPFEEREPETVGEAETEKDAQRKATAEMIQRYIDQQQKAQQASRSSGSDDDPEAEWEQMSSTARAQWLRAYYAEYGGDMELRSVRFAACPTCGGTGVLEFADTGSAGNKGESSSGLRIVTCPSCHTAGIIRRISYR